MNANTYQFTRLPAPARRHLFDAVLHMPQRGVWAMARRCAKAGLPPEAVLAAMRATGIAVQPKRSASAFEAAYASARQPARSA